MRFFADAPEVEDNEEVAGAEEAVTEGGTQEEVDARRQKRREKKRKANAKKLAKKHAELEAQGIVMPKPGEVSSKKNKKQKTKEKGEDSGREPSTSKGSSSADTAPAAPAKSFYDPFTRKRIVINQPATAQTAKTPTQSAKKKEESDDDSWLSDSSSDDEDRPTKQTKKPTAAAKPSPSNAKKPLPKAAVKKKPDSSEDEGSDLSSSEEGDAPPKKSVNAPTPRAMYDPFAKKKITAQSKPSQPAKQLPEDSSDDESTEEDEPSNRPNAQPAAAPAKTMYDPFAKKKILISNKPAEGAEETPCADKKSKERKNTANKEESGVASAEPGDVKSFKGQEQPYTAGRKVKRKAKHLKFDNSDDSDSESAPHSKSAAHNEKQEEEEDVQSPKRRKADTPNKTKDPAEHKHILFVGQLPFTTTKEQLLAHFQSCTESGGGISTRLLTDKNTNKPRGIGFVQFENAADAERGLLLDYSNLGGRRIRVERTANGKGNNKNRKEVITELKNKQILEKRRVVEEIVNKCLQEQPSHIHDRLMRHDFDSRIMDFLFTIPLPTVEKAVAESVSLDLKGVKNRAAYVMGLIKGRAEGRAMDVDYY